MAWTDRLREAAYTSPGGTRAVFLYEDVSTKTAKRGTPFEFPGVDGGYIQDTGHGPRRFPLQCIFAGADCDLEAEAFEALLLEAGVGRLEHPLYGVHDVVPMGDVSRTDRLKTGGGEAVVAVTMWRTLGAVYPTTQGDPGAAADTALEDFSESSGVQFEENTDLTTTVARENVITRFEETTAVVSAALAPIAATVDEIRDRFEEAESTLLGSLDTLILEPVALVEDATALVTLPAEASASITARLTAYGDLLTTVITTPPALPGQAFLDGAVLPGRKRKIANDFHTQLVFAAATVAGSVTAVLEHTFRTRPEALGAAGVLLDQLGTMVGWMDGGFADLGARDSEELDSGRAYQALQNAVAIAAGFLVEISFTLLPERRLVLDRPRTIIDVCSEVYGTIDDQLDFFIESNDLSGSEILELPAGRVILYYA